MGLYADKYSAVLGFVFAVIFLALGGVCVFATYAAAHSGLMLTSVADAFSALFCLLVSGLFVRAFFKKPALHTRDAG
jgi:hypothetical protein